MDRETTEEIKKDKRFKYLSVKGLDGCEMLIPVEMINRDELKKRVKEGFYKRDDNSLCNSVSFKK